MHISISANSYSVKTFSYGLTQLPQATLRAQKTCLRFVERDKVDLPMFDPTDYPYGVLQFSSPLNQTQIDDYGLIDLNGPSQDRIWNAFVGFVKRLREASPAYTLKNFVTDYVSREGQRCTENPLYRYAQPNSDLVFTYLRKYTKYKPNYKGLEEFWENCGSK